MTHVLTVRKKAKQNENQWFFLDILENWGCWANTIEKIKSQITEYLLFGIDGAGAKLCKDTH